ncbi:MAG: MFS transporter [Proteobacteria bacterium]|nr:MAG: MFS transporter [Pseudomonadota bacterium]
MFIFVTVMLDMIGIGLIIPVLPDVMRRFVNGETAVAEYFGYFIAVYALMQFVASPLLGSLSDRYGRRPVLLVSLLMAGLDYILMALAPSLGILFAGRVISGLTGASITVAMAYVADVSDETNRSANFGKIGAAFGLGFIIGPALGGLAGSYDPRAPFFLAAGMNLLNFFFGLLVLPESVPASQRRRLELSRLNPMGTLLKVLRMPGLLALLVVYFLASFAGNTHGVVWTLYTESRFGWTAFGVGASLALVGVLAAISQGMLTGRIVGKLGEAKTVLYGSFGWALAFLLYGLATEGWMMITILVTTSVFMVTQPAIQSLLTSSAPPEAQGELQGSLVSLQSLAAIINPLITSRLFAHFNAPEANPRIPGAPYFFSALVCVVSIPFLLSAYREHHVKL